MTKKTIISLAASILFSLSLAAGDLCVMKGDEKVKLASYSNQKEFVRVLAKHMAAPGDVEAEKKGIYGLMFLVMPTPRETSIVRQVSKRIQDFYKFPGNYDLVRQESDRLYRTKEELTNSEELQHYVKKYGFYEVFIIGIDVKYEKMHSISKPNGERIFLDPWYKD